MMKTKILTLKILGAKRQKILGDNQIFFPPKLLVHCSLRNSGTGKNLVVPKDCFSHFTFKFIDVRNSAKIRIMTHGRA